MPERLLLIEDDDAVADVVALHLRSADFGVRREADGRVALQALAQDPVDLVLLDLMLPGADGWEICRHLRTGQAHVPIIMLSARSTEAERVLGLELGADDYLPKPFSMLELTARVRALLRRREQWRRPGDTAPTLHVGRLEIDTARRGLRLRGQAVPLTLREFDLLHFMARHADRVFSRGELLARVWGTGFDGYEHTVNSHINRLRQKIERDPQQPALIETVWGQGYRFNAAAADT